MPDSALANSARTNPLQLDDTPLREIEQRIMTDIRTILLTVGLATLGLITAGVSFVLWYRRRKRTPDDVLFSEQVERLLDDLQFEMSETRAMSEFERKRQDIMDELDTIRAEAEQEPSPVAAPEEPEPLAATLREERATRPLITGEVKSLVARLNREGTPVEQIARIADLTTTEVQLMLTIREHTLNQLAVSFRDDEPESGAGIATAVRSLRREGFPPREIARRLSISLSEVELALSLDGRRGTDER
jgi:hypothetical protein